MDKISSFSKQFLWSEIDDINFPSINFETIEDKNDIESIYHFNGFHDLTLSSPKNEPKINKIKFVTKPNKTSFIISKKKHKEKKKV